MNKKILIFLQLYIVVCIILFSLEVVFLFTHQGNLVRIIDIPLQLIVLGMHVYNLNTQIRFFRTDGPGHYFYKINVFFTVISVLGIVLASFYFVKDLKYLLH